jgi:hypothetical protein
MKKGDTVICAIEYMMPWAENIDGMEHFVLIHESMVGVIEDMNEWGLIVSFYGVRIVADYSDFEQGLLTLLPSKPHLSLVKGGREN